MSKWINYKMDSKFHEQPFLVPSKLGGKGTLAKTTSYMPMLGGGSQFRLRSGFEGSPFVLPLLPKQSSFNSSRIAKDKVYFN